MNFFKLTYRFSGNSILFSNTSSKNVILLTNDFFSTLEVNLRKKHKSRFSKNRKYNKLGFADFFVDEN